MIPMDEHSFRYVGHRELTPEEKAEGRKVREWLHSQFRSVPEREE